MKMLLAALLTIFSVSAQAANQVRLFAFVNVEESASTISTDASGNVDVDSFSFETSYIIGWSDSLRQQVVSKVNGCSLISPKTIKLLISDTPNSYAGMFSKTTYTLTLSNKAECKEVQKQLRRVTYDRPVVLNIDAASKTFTLQ